MIAAPAFTKAAVAQMTSTPDVASNLAAVERLVERAAGEGAQLLLLPECFAFLGPEDGKLVIAEPLPKGGPILQRCQALAQGHRLELLLGGFWERSDEPGKVHNTTVQLHADGSIGAIYRKVHLFDVDLPNGVSHCESESVAAGRQTVLAETPIGKLGLSICYDLRFPELYRRLVKQGATVLSIPAAFLLTTGKDHWQVLLRARAIENQCYVLAAAQTGLHYGTRISYGHASIVDPWGAVVAQCSEGEGIAVAGIDARLTERVRQNMPCLQHAIF